jgi:NAD(P)-dependent dehydrogenase (short-subunit alcohol dehydrogenase family)
MNPIARLSPSCPSDSVAVVTGGATGVGRAVCRHFAAAGAGGVVVNYNRSQAEAARAVEELRELGCNAVAVAADVGRPDDVAAMTDAVLERYGRIDFLINNAATTRAIPFERLEEITDGDWRRIFDVNLHGAFRCTMAAADALRRSAGAVVNITSVSATRAAGTSIPYAVSKAALLHLTRCLARAMAPDVRVNAVSPGAIATRWGEQFAGHVAAEEQHRADAAATPLGRIATPEDIAAAVVNLATLHFVTGQEIVVDGGRSMIH